MNLAPAIHVPRKSTHGPCDESRAIKAGLFAAQGCTQPFPIVFGRKVLGLACGRSWPDPTVFYSRETDIRCAFNNYTPDVPNAIAKGQWIRAVFQKVASTASISNNWYDYWPTSLSPEPGTFTGAAFTSRAFTDTDFGAMKIGNAVSPQQKMLMSLTMQSSNTISIYMLYDRLLAYEACSFNANAQQNMINGATLPRYQNAGQSGGSCIVPVQTVLGATASTLTQLAYTNNAGVGHNMPTDIVPQFIASAAAPTANLAARLVCPSLNNTSINAYSKFLPVVTGDQGMRSIQSFTTSAANSGTFAFVLVRPLATFLCAPGAGLVATQIDQIVDITNFEPILDGACVNFLGMQNTTTNTVLGSIDVMWN